MRRERRGDRLRLCDRAHRLRPAAFGAFAALVAATGVLGARAVPAVDDPLGLYQSDAAELVPFVGERAESADELTSLFYRSSSIVGVIVGLSLRRRSADRALRHARGAGDPPAAARARHLHRLPPRAGPGGVVQSGKGGTLADVKLVNVVTGLWVPSRQPLQTMRGAAAFAAPPGTEFTTRCRRRSATRSPSAARRRTPTPPSPSASSSRCSTSRRRRGSRPTRDRKFCTGAYLRG